MLRNVAYRNKLSVEAERGCEGVLLNNFQLSFKHLAQFKYHNAIGYSQIRLMTEDLPEFHLHSLIYNTDGLGTKMEIVDSRRNERIYKYNYAQASDYLLIKAPVYLHSMQTDRKDIGVE